MCSFRLSHFPALTVKKGQPLKLCSKSEACIKQRSLHKCLCTCIIKFIERVGDKGKMRGLPIKAIIRQTVSFTYTYMCEHHWRRIAYLYTHESNHRSRQTKKN